MTQQFLGIAGSLRKHSTNKGLLRAAQANLPDDVSMEIAEIGDIPFYNADITDKPASVLRVFAQIAAADALVFACTEYNYSLAPALKNVIDWASREPDNKLLKGKYVALMGAGGGMGTSRAQYHMRQVCVFCDLYPLYRPEIFSNAFSSSFDEEGNLVDSKIEKLIIEQMQTLSRLAYHSPHN